MNAKRLLTAACVISLYLTCPAYAQLYKWVGPDGKVTYSDVPPPKTAAKVEKKSVALGNAEASLPFELATAARSNPVTLYTAAQCGPCDAARQLLTERGIPFTEKTVNGYEEQTRFRKITGGLDFPYLQVGANNRKGFESDSWNSALTQAGYPTNNMLPRGYQNRPAAPIIAAKPKEEPAPVEKQEDRPAIKPKENNNTAPPGFQF